MKFRLFLPINLFVITVALSPLAIAADPLSWSTEVYTVKAQAGEVLDWHGSCISDPENWCDVDFMQGTPPISASASWSAGTTSTAYSEMTSSTMYVEVNSPHIVRAQAEADFAGTYTADNPFFIFSYDGSVGLTVENLTTSTTLFDQWVTGFDSLYISTPVDDEISVNVHLEIPESVRTSRSMSLTYNMAVAPEPVSSTLFIIGGSLLGMKGFRKNRKNI